MFHDEVFQDRLRGLRTSKSLSQRQAAEKFGITKICYQNYESGRGRPSVNVLTALADFFGVSIDYLVGRTSNPKVAC